MPKNPNYPDQDQLLILSPEQQDPGLAKATDFKVQESNGKVFTGQADPALLGMSQLIHPDRPLPDRNYVRTRSHDQETEA